MDEVVQISPSFGRQLLDLMQEVARLRRDVRAASIPRVSLAEDVLVRNASGAEIPAWACMAVTGLEMIGDKPRFIVNKPSTTFNRDYLVNRGQVIAVGGLGTAQSGPKVRVLYDTGSTPAAGNGYGPVPGQWYVGQHYPETLLVAGEHEDEETLLGQWHDINKWMGEAAEEIADEGSGDVTVFKGVSGSMTTAGYDPVECHSAFGLVEDESAVWVETASGSNWEIIQARCPA